MEGSCRDLCRHLLRDTEESNEQTTVKTAHIRPGISTRTCRMMSAILCTATLDKHCGYTTSSALSEERLQNLSRKI